MEGEDCMVFSLVKRDRGRPKRILEKIVKRDLMVNNIPKSLVFITESNDII